MAESLCCSPETTRILLIGYTSIQNVSGVKKKITKKKERKKQCSCVGVMFLRLPGFKLA